MKYLTIGGLVLGIACITTGYAQEQYTIQGHVTGRRYTDSTVIYLEKALHLGYLLTDAQGKTKYVQWQFQTIDSCQLVDDHFRFTGEVDEPTLAFIGVGTAHMPLVLENGNIQFNDHSFQTPNYTTKHATGTPLNDQLAHLKDLHGHLLSQAIQVSVAERKAKKLPVNSCIDNLTQQDKLTTHQHRQEIKVTADSLFTGIKNNIHNCAGRYVLHTTYPWFNDKQQEEIIQLDPTTENYWPHKQGLVKVVYELNGITK